MKIRILAIIPYVGMKEIMNEIAAANPDIELTVRVGTLEEGLEIVRSYNLDYFDIIAARGGTARLIEKHVNIPVVNIDISVYDILRAIRLAQNYTSHFAIIGISSITANAILLNNLLQYNIRIVTLDNVDQSRQAMEQLLSEGYEMVLCDTWTTKTAYAVGLNYILITSSLESVQAAIDQAVHTARLYSFYRRQSRLFRAAFDGSHESLFIYDSDRQLIFSSLSQNEETANFFETIEQNLDNFYSDSAYRLEKRSNALLLTCRCNHVTIYSEQYLYVYLHLQNAPAPTEDLGISVFESNRNIPVNTDYYGSANLIGATRKSLDLYSKTAQPILILGEPGTGKDKAASYLHAHSDYKKNTLFVIDCESVSPKKWNYFMESPNSPLNDLHSTIYIKNMQVLSNSISNKLLPYLKQNNLCQQNRIIFSYVFSFDQDILNSTCQYLINTLLCVPLRLPALRERAEDLPNIATLYISQTNIETGKQVVGFEPGAMKLIQNFNWKYNLAQLKRVIRQLIILTDTDYISTELVRQTLKQETPKVETSLPPGHEIINTNQSLEEINHDIIRMVLEQENQNRSRTVERLKISRTTLWRMLQK